MEKVPEGLDLVSDEFYRFYGVKRGHHPNARAGFTTTSDLAFINYPLLDHIDEISPRPILLIIGDRAASRFFSEQVYERAAEPKELMSWRMQNILTCMTEQIGYPLIRLKDF